MGIVFFWGGGDCFKQFNLLHSNGKRIQYYIRVLLERKNICVREKEMVISVGLFFGRHGYVNISPGDIYKQELLKENLLLLDI